MKSNLGALASYPEMKIVRELLTVGVLLVGL